MSRAHKLMVATLTWTLVALSAPAHAHPDLDSGKRLAAELEFERALAAFERALYSSSLKREELIALLAERALVLHALHRHRDLLENFTWLSALDPDHRLDLRAPPDLIAIWTAVRAQGRGALEVTLAAQANERGELAATASMRGTVPEGARARIVLRKPNGAWRIVESSELADALPESGLELYAEALTLGSVVIARDHSPESPLRVNPARETSPATPLEESSSSGSWARRYRGALIGSAAAIVAIAIVSVVVTTRRSSEEREMKHSDSTVLQPMVSF